MPNDAGQGKEQSVRDKQTGVAAAAASQALRSDHGASFDAVLGKGQVISGWEKGLVGQTVGSCILLVQRQVTTRARSGLTTNGR